jgi:zinc-ribbon domain
MQCWNCGSTVRPGAKLCVYCGANLADGADPRGDDGDRRNASHDDDGGRGHRPPGRDARAPGRSSRDARPQPRSRRDEPDDDWDAPPENSLGATAPAYQRRGSRPPTRPRQDDIPSSRSSRGGSGRHAYDDPSDDTTDETADRPRALRSSQRRPADDRGAGDARGERYADPLDDPRAPRVLRGSAAEGGGGRDSGSRSSRDRREGRDEGYGAGRGDEREGRGRRAAGAGSQQTAWDERDDARAYGAPARVPPRRDGTPPLAADPMEDSWGMSAFQGGAESSGWTDPSAAWGAAPSEAYPAARSPARSGRRASGRGARGAAREPRGLGVAMVALVVLALVILVAGVVLVPTILSNLHHGGATTSGSTFVAYTPGPTPTPAPNYAYFPSKRSAYILAYPQSWTAKEQPAQGDDNLDTFAAVGGVPLLNVEQAGAFANLSDSAVILSEVQSGQKQGATYTEDTAVATTAAIGGEQWTRHEFDVTNGGAKFRMAILSCHHHGRGYVLVLVSAPADFAKLNSGAFQTMLASFRFVG